MTKKKYVKEASSVRKLGVLLNEGKIAGGTGQMISVQTKRHGLDLSVTQVSKMLSVLAADGEIEQRLMPGYTKRYTYHALSKAPVVTLAEPVIGPALGSNEVVTSTSEPSLPNPVSTAEDLTREAVLASMDAYHDTRELAYLEFVQELVGAMAMLNERLEAQVQSTVPEPVT